jgi:hypothetical protein
MLPAQRVHFSISCMQSTELVFEPRLSRCVRVWYTRIHRQSRTVNVQVHKCPKLEPTLSKRDRAKSNQLAAHNHCWHINRHHPTHTSNNDAGCLSCSSARARLQVSQMGKTQSVSGLVKTCALDRQKLQLMALKIAFPISQLE